jgi:hypothetical protein
VFSVDDLQGTEADAATKRLASRLAAKWKRTYSEVCGFVRSRLAIRLVNDKPLPARGSRLGCSSHPCYMRLGSWARPLLLSDISSGLWPQRSTLGLRPHHHDPPISRLRPSTRISPNPNGHVATHNLPRPTFTHTPTHSNDCSVAEETDFEILMDLTSYHRHLKFSQMCNGKSDIFGHSGTEKQRQVRKSLTSRTNGWQGTLFLGIHSYNMLSAFILER